MFWRGLRGQDRHLHLSMKEGFLEALPISVLMTMISWQGAMTFLMVVCLHHYIWNQIHMEMHKPEKRFFSQIPPDLVVKSQAIDISGVI